MSAKRVVHALRQIAFIDSSLKTPAQISAAGGAL